MKAIVHRSYGPPDGLRLEEIERPEVGDDDVLVRVRAVGLNPADWHMMRGAPRIARLMFGVLRPKRITISSRSGAESSISIRLTIVNPLIPITVPAG